MTDRLDSIDADAPPASVHAAESCSRPSEQIREVEQKRPDVPPVCRGSNEILDGLLAHALACRCVGGTHRPECQVPRMYRAALDRMATPESAPASTSPVVPLSPELQLLITLAVAWREAGVQGLAGHAREVENARRAFTMKSSGMSPEDLRDVLVMLDRLTRFPVDENELTIERARLDWCAEHVEDFTRVRDLHAIDWIGDDGEMHETATRGKDWRATIDQAMREDEALTAQIAEGVRAEQDKAAEADHTFTEQPNA